MRKRTVKPWRLHEDGRKLFAGNEVDGPVGQGMARVADRLEHGS
jgi:hypothetical protein